MKAPIPAIEICAGAGGLSLGLTRAGFAVHAVEVDPDAVDTHRRHAGPCELADVRTWHPAAPAVLVAGGVPCTPFSAAGLGLGLDDPRYLVPQLLRVAREASAEVVLLENVRGLVLRHPRAFRVVLDAFEAEWITTWTVIDAADQGVPQNRDRLFVIGFKDPAARARLKWPDLTHWPAFKLDGPRERTADGKRGRRSPGTLGLFDTTYRTVRQALGLPAGSFKTGRIEGASGWNGQRLLDVDAPAVCVTSRTNPDLLDRPSPCVTATEQKSAMSGSQPMGRRRRASESLSDALRELGPLDRPARTVSAGGTEGGGGPEPFANADYRRELAAGLEAAGLADRPATTVQADPRLAVAGHHDRQQNGAVRLSPAQCAALQGFPAGWTFTGNKSSQHRQIGNAVPPGLGEAVGRSIAKAVRP